jgi:hypothetical protein
LSYACSIRPSSSRWDWLSLNTHEKDINGADKMKLWSQSGQAICCTWDQTQRSAHTVVTESEITRRHQHTIGHWAQDLKFSPRREQTREPGAKARTLVSTNEFPHGWHSLSKWPAGILEFRKWHGGNESFTHRHGTQ